MKTLCICAAYVVVFASSLLTAAEPASYPTFGKVHRLDPAFDALVAPDAKLEKLAEGFEWSEGPVWVPEGQFLLFSDIPNNAVMKWKEGEGATVFIKPSGYTGSTPRGGEPGSNGLILDKKGRLISCEHGDHRISRMNKLAPNGKKITLVDNYMGKELNSPNDGVLKSNGELYFTDPPYGRPEGKDDPNRDLDFCGVYRLKINNKGENELTLLTKDIAYPNGIGFSPDEKTLYVAQSNPVAANWTAYDVQADGTIANGRVFYDMTDQVSSKPGAPDGLKVDTAGNLWATGPGGVHVFSPAGKLLGTIETGERTANCAFGGDGSVLYITADMYLARIQTKTMGLGF